jgi:hypothetical protein
MPLSKQAALSKDKTSGLAPMQHRHFATIATIIREMPANGTALGQFAPEQVAELFANRLGETNPRFDRDRFLAACEVRND